MAFLKIFNVGIDFNGVIPDITVLHKNISDNTDLSLIFLGITRAGEDIIFEFNRQLSLEESHILNDLVSYYIYYTPNFTDPIPGFMFPLSEGSKPYGEFSRTSWETIRCILLPGTRQLNPKKVRLIVSSNNNNALKHFRMVDVYSSEILTEVSWKNSDQDVIEGVLSNMHFESSIVELQACTDKSNSYARIHWFELSL